MADVIVSTGAEGAWLSRAQGSRGAPHVASFHHPLAHWVGPRQLLAAGGKLTRRGIARTYKLWDEYLERISMGRAELVVCSSQDQASRVVNDLRIPSPKVKMIYYGIDTDRFVPLPSRRASLNRNILYAGGPWPSKGIDVLLEAFAKIRPRFPDARISLVGAGDWTPYEIKIKALGLSDHVCNYGHVSHEDMGRLYRNACLLAAPTRHESFGLVLGEAMACGLPVIATGVTAIPEVVVDGVTGLLAPVNNCVAVANALEALLGDPQRAVAMGEAGRVHVEESFGWSKIIQQWEQLLQQVVSRSFS
jgi:glycosyltransferase involved in cell wall biosynthesis